MGEGIKTRRGKSKGVLRTYLYNEGDQSSALTGGWSAYNYLVQSGLSVAYSFVDPTFNINNIDFTLPNVAFKNTGASHTLAIDVTNYSRLRVEYTSNNLLQGNYLNVSTSKTTIAESFINIIKVGNNLVAELDITNLSGNKFISFNINTGGSEANGGTIIIHKIWFE